MLRRPPGDADRTRSARLHNPPVRSGSAPDSSRKSRARRSRPGWRCGSAGGANGAGLRSSSPRYHIARHGHAFEQTIFGPIVPHGIMLRRAIVPDANGVGRPAKAHLIFGNLDAVEEQAEQAITFLLADANDPAGEGVIEDRKSVVWGKSV